VARNESAPLGDLNSGEGNASESSGSGGGGGSEKENAGESAGDDGGSEEENVGESAGGGGASAESRSKGSATHRKEMKLEESSDDSEKAGISSLFSLSKSRIGGLGEDNRWLADRATRFEDVVEGCTWPVSGSRRRY